MLFFDEELLTLGLRQLSNRDLIVYAAAVAARQIRNFENFSSSREIPSGILRDIHVELVKAFPFESIDEPYWKSRFESVMSLLPQGEEESTPGSAFADDAVSSTAYALKCLLEPSVQEAAWAARRAYEATDEAAIILNGINPGNPEGTSKSQAEKFIAEHEIVQRELIRQKRDLKLLLEGASDMVQRQALEEELFSASEYLAIVRL